MIFPVCVSAQDAAVHADITRFIWSEAGLKAECYSSAYRTGLGAGFSLPILRRLAAGFTARAYPVGDGPSCIIDEPFPQNGTVTHDNRVPLQVTRFLTTDLRLEAQVAGPLLAALGGGMAWRTAHAGPDVPELLGALAIRVPSRSNFRFAFGAEYFMVRTAWDEWQVTYTNSMAVSSTPPVRKHQWQSGLSLTFSAIRVF